ncbi:hypothetical protein [Oceanithermus sp.]
MVQLRWPLLLALAGLLATGCYGAQSGSDTNPDPEPTPGQGPTLAGCPVFLADHV